MSRKNKYKGLGIDDIGDISNINLCGEIDLSELYPTLGKTETRIDNISFKLKGIAEKERDVFKNEYDIDFDIICYNNNIHNINDSIFRASKTSLGFLHFRIINDKIYCFITKYDSGNIETPFLIIEEPDYNDDCKKYVESEIRKAIYDNFVLPLIP